MGIFSHAKSSPRQWTAALPIRALWPDDMGQVMRIERDSFPCPWSYHDFDPCFAIGSGRLIHGAELNGCLAGYCVSKCDPQHVLWILNLAVLPGLRRQGVARALLEYVAYLPHFKPQRLRAIVGETNLDAQLFFRAAGWRAVGMERRPFEVSDEEGIRFVKRVITRKN